MAALTFLDSTVFIAGIVDLGASSRAPMAILDAVAEQRIQAATAWHCCLEVYSVLTRLPVEFRLAPAMAKTLVVEEVMERVVVLSLEHDRQPGLLDEAGRLGVAGGRIYDAHIGEVALAGGATQVVTDNLRHFRWLPTRGVAVVSTAEFAASLGGA